MATPVVMPAGAINTPASASFFGSYTPQNIRDLQSSFYLSYRQVISLTSAQILALQTTAVTLIPAPGPGLMIVPEAFIIKVQGLTAAYTDAGGAVSFNVGTMTTALAANTIFTGPTNGQRSQQIVSFAGTSTAANPPTNENAALTISKATNNFAAGSGTATITVFYSIEQTT